MTIEKELSERVKTLLDDWVDTIKSGNSDWFRENLSDDFSATAHPIPGLYLNREEFIEADAAIKEIDVEFVDVRAWSVGDIVVSQAVAKMGVTIVREGGDSATGPDPSFDEKIAGKHVFYASGWRRDGDRLVCFDHHLMGTVD